MLIKFLHITLIFSLLSSSVGVVVNQHFCKDELKRISFYTAVRSCHEPETQKKPACPYHQEKSAENGLDKKDCCQSTSDLVKTSQEQQVEPTDLTGYMVPVAVSPTGENSDNFTFSAHQISAKYYRPPPLISDYSVFFQIFRL